MNEQVISLYKEGKSFLEIAAQCGKSKGQVAGIVFRYRKSLLPKPVKIETVFKPEPPREVEENVDIMGLKSYSCRFPVSVRENVHIFCGKNIVDGSYCKEHYQLTHAPSYIKAKTTAHYRQ